MYLIHIRNFRVLSGLFIILIFRSLILKPGNNNFTVGTKHNTIPCKNPIRCASYPSGIRVGIGLLARPYVSRMISASNGQRTQKREIFWLAKIYPFFGSTGAHPPQLAGAGARRTMSISSKPVPVQVYLNPDKEKEFIVNENKGRTGIYRWVHIEQGKSYVGSAKNLSIRFKQYFNYNHITYPKRNMRIYKALLKYGYAEFRLEILEYCSPEVLIEREQFYFDTLIPEYNILKIAGSPLGYRHSEASKKLISLGLPSP